MTTIALALGAGGARGIAHIHVLKAFDDLGITPKVIAGTSIGSIMGAAYAAGMTGAEIESYVLENLNNRAALLKQVFKMKPDSVKSFMADGGLRIGEINLETVLAVALPDTLPASYDALGIPLYVAATDFYAGRTRIFSSGPLAVTLAASAAIPAIFLPVKIAGRYYIDGSSTDPCPLDIVQDKADKVIAIDVSGGPQGSPSTRPSKIDVLSVTGQIMQQSIVRAKARRFPETLVLRPPVSNYRALDFLKVSDILTETAGLQDLVKTRIDALYNAPS